MVLSVLSGLYLHIYIFQRDDESSNIKKDLERLEKKNKELKEKIKGKLGAGLADDDDEAAPNDEEEANE